MKNIPAFPTDNTTEPYSGMTLRDYFAAKALDGLLSNDALHEDYFEDTDFLKVEDVDLRRKVVWVLFANSAYEIADAMLKARGK